MTSPHRLITASPHLGVRDSTPKIMWSVVGSLVPIIAAATWLFGPSVPLVLLAATVGAVLTERAFGSRGSLGDGSAAITGLLLGLSLPAGLPLWMAFVGGAFGIGFGKLIFGGLGQNVFNPALLGRAFLQAAFPDFRVRGQGPGWGGGRWLHFGNDVCYVALDQARHGARHVHVRVHGDR